MHEPELMYVVRVQAFGTIGGKEVSSGKAPAQHSCMSVLLGFYPAQVHQPVGFGGVEGFAICVEQPERDGVFALTLTMTPDFAAKSPEVPVLYSLIVRLGRQKPPGGKR